MKLTYKKDKSFEFEFKYVEIHIKVYMTSNENRVSFCYDTYTTEFDVSLFELMDSQLSINNYTLNKFPELKQMHRYSIRIMVTDIKLYVCDLIFGCTMESLIPQYDDMVHHKKDDLLFDLSYKQKDGGSDITVTFLNCMLAESYDIDPGKVIHLSPEWFNVVYD